MKASDLRIGNIVGVCYEDIFTADKVIILEPGIVHLSNRENPDDERDIEGVPLHEDWLKNFNFKYNPILESWECKDIVVKKLPTESANSWMILSKAGQLKIAFVHELQNLLHLLSQVN